MCDIDRSDSDPLSNPQSQLPCLSTAQTQRCRPRPPPVPPAPPAMPSPGLRPVGRAALPFPSPRSAPNRRCRSRHSRCITASGCGRSPWSEPSPCSGAPPPHPATGFQTCIGGKVALFWHAFGTTVRSVAAEVGHLVLFGPTPRATIPWRLLRPKHLVHGGFQLGRL